MRRTFDCQEEADELIEWDDSPPRPTSHIPRIVPKFSEKIKKNSVRKTSKFKKKSQLKNTNKPKLDVTYTPCELYSKKVNDNDGKNVQHTYSCNNLNKKKLIDTSRCMNISPRPSPNRDHDCNVSPIIEFKKKQRLETFGNKIESFRITFNQNKNLDEEIVEIEEVEEVDKIDEINISDEIYDSDEISSPIIKPIRSIYQLNSDIRKQKASKVLFPAENFNMKISETSENSRNSLNISTEPSTSSCLTSRINSITSLESPQGKSENNLKLSSLDSSQNKKEAATVSDLKESIPEANSSNETDESREVTLIHSIPPFQSPISKRRRKLKDKRSLEYRFKRVAGRARSDFSFWNHANYLRKHTKILLPLDTSGMLLLKIINSVNDFGLFIIKCENIMEDDSILKSKYYRVVMHQTLIRTITIKCGWTMKVFTPYRIYELGKSDKIINTIVNVRNYEILKTDNKSS